jgi:ABC-type transport system substrate-binding protein
VYVVGVAVVSDNRRVFAPQKMLGGSTLSIHRAVKSARFRLWLRVRRRFASCAIAVAFVLATQMHGFRAAAAAETPQRGGVLHVAANAEPTTLDCMTTTATACHDFAENFLEPLYTIDRGFRVVPMLADGYPNVSSDGKTVSIRVRRGVVFHDGSPLRAQDVLASIERWGRLTGAGKVVFGFVRSVEATDPLTGICKTGSGMLSTTIAAEASYSEAA